MNAEWPAINEEAIKRDKVKVPSEVSKEEIEAASMAPATRAIR